MKNTVTQRDIDKLFEESEVKTSVMFDKCLLMAVKLPNGFIITESSACVDPVNFDEKLGIKICTERVKNKLWELEGYMLQRKLGDSK